MDEAAEMFERCRILGESQGDSANHASIFLAIGVLHLDSGNYDMASEYTTRGLSLARRVGDKEAIKVGLANLSTIAARRKDYAQAYALHKQFAEISDSLVNEANLRSINEMQAKYESEQKEKAIALLEKDKQVQALELERKRSELTLQKVETDRNRQRAELYRQQHEVQKLKLDNESAAHRKDLELGRLEKEKREREMDMLTRENKHREEINTRERGALLGGLALFSVIGVLGVKRVQAKRVEASLRAETAEYKAQVAEAEVMRTQAESERRRRKEQQEFSRQLIASQEDERSRIAAELHDQLGQDLVVIRNSILVALEEGRGDENLLEAGQTAGMMLENVRRLARDLRPYQLDRYGLTNALEAMITRVGKTCPTRFTAEIDPLDGLFDKTGEITLYRIVQEGVSNIVRHAGAAEAMVRAVRSDDVVELVIEDDGNGIAALVLQDDSLIRHHRHAVFAGGKYRGSHLEVERNIDIGIAGCGGHRNCGERGCDQNCYEDESCVFHDQPPRASAL